MTIPAGPAGPARGPWPRIEFSQRTDPGRDPDKQENEDSAHYQETHLGHLMVLCDGMGGHASGREASTAAIRAIFEHVLAAPRTASPGETLKRAIEVAGQAVFGIGGPAHNPARPGSTCVAVLMHPLGTEVAHIGDSRVYVVRAGQIWPLTRDHSMVQGLVDAGLLHKDDAATHPDANKILKALGMSPEVDVELRQEIVLQQSRDLFLLMSDGVTDVLRDSDLLAVAKVAAETGQIALMCEQIVQLANARGGPDNITVQAAFVVDPGLAAHAVASRGAPTQVGADDSSSRTTSPGEPRAPSTVRLPAAPNATPSPTAQARPAPAPPVRGRGATQKLDVVASPIPGVGTPSTPNAPARTVVDNPGTDEDDEDLPAMSGRADGSSGRGARVAIGLVMVVAGLVVMTLSIRSLLYEDEAPPPLVDVTPTASHAPTPLPSSSRVAP